MSFEILIPLKTPLFSLITPVLNAGATLPDTIASVAGQNFSDFEWVVQDGGSTDKGPSLLAGCPGVSLEIAADTGLYDAMNKAAARSRGKWLLFLQADDWLEDGALASLAEVADSSPGAEVLAGGCSAICLRNGTMETVWERNSPEAISLIFSTLALGEPMLNARAYRRDVWEKMGPFHTRWSLAADRAWLLELARKAPSMGILQRKIYRYRWHDGSKTMNAGNALSARLTRENLEIAETLSTNANAAELAVLKQWHKRESIRLAMNQLENFEFSSLVKTLRPQGDFSSGLLTGLAAEVLRCLPGFVCRGGKTKSALRCDAGRIKGMLV